MSVLLEMEFERVTVLGGIVTVGTAELIDLQKIDDPRFSELRYKNSPSGIATNLTLLWLFMCELSMLLFTQVYAHFLHWNGLIPAWLR